MTVYVDPVLVGIALALCGRVLGIVLGRRQFPTYPHGEIVHFFLGFVAGALGALAVPSLLTANVTAGVFLGIGTQQFHSVRGQERATLLNLDAASRVQRGKAYIEDMVQQFEAQNFLLLGVSLLTTLVAVKLGLLPGAAVGLSALVSAHFLFGPRRVGRMADVFVQTDLDGGDAAGPAVDVLVHPHGPRSAAVLRNPGQQQAMVHDLHAVLGSRVGADGDEKSPHVRVASGDGTIHIRLWPVDQDLALVRQAVSNVPVLESIAAPLKAEAKGRRA